MEEESSLEQVDLKAQRERSLEEKSSDGNDARCNYAKWTIYWTLFVMAEPASLLPYACQGSTTTTRRTKTHRWIIPASSDPADAIVRRVACARLAFLDEAAEKLTRLKRQHLCVLSEQTERALS